MRPVLECISVATDCVEQQVDFSDESNEDQGQADIGLDEIASLVYEFHFTLCEKRKFPLEDDHHGSQSVVEFFRPPATLA